MRFLTLVVCAALVVSACGGDDAEPARDEATGQVTDDGNVRADRVRLGDCFMDSDDRALEAIPAVPCDEPHDNEVFHLFDVREPGDGEFPGDRRIADEARTGCLESFEPFVGASFEESVYQIYPITPSDQSWGNGDREVICAIYETNSNGDTVELTGSAKGTNR